VRHRDPVAGVGRRRRKLDHSAIYLLIAGTYTPFTLVAMQGAWGWSLFGVVWALAALGVVAKTTVGFRYPRLSTFLYVDLRSLEKISSSMRPNCAPRWSE
jgi:hemolysin III